MIFHILHGVEEEVIAQHERIWLYNKINELDNLSKNIVLLRISSNLSFSEISQILNKSENYVRVNFYRTKEKLKKDNNNERKEHQNE